MTVSVIPFPGTESEVSSSALLVALATLRDALAPGQSLTVPAVLDRAAVLEVLATFIPIAATPTGATSVPAVPVTPVSAVTAPAGDEREPMPPGWSTTLLKWLLIRRHWQTYRTFCREYDKAAKTIDPRLVGKWPSRCQLHRWMSGGLRTGMPYPEHCMVLEAMFPGYSAEELFQVGGAR
ncbi:hypothetical protein [Phytohabitans houttuyneae]|uniref:Uncharacterized protein n=1 Tax=Phytohabitans houttuyneae TaxID=1076126 RepID=A0A6V8KMP3_9ACTN|nr:hypothetical protein [Phytohabitans houttuyneae]GFJ85124.1 hypothetical protein Phou_093040 [Phytohabitans houttuyneae]